MDALDVMALFCLAMMAVIFVSIFIFLGSLPGQIAKKRGHPNAKAIPVGGWATLVFALVGWPFVLMWAMAKQDSKKDQVDDAESEADNTLNRQVRELGQRLAAIEEKLKQAEG
jgi:hypothetical protein